MHSGAMALPIPGHITAHAHTRTHAALATEAFLTLSNACYFVLQATTCSNLKPTPPYTPFVYAHAPALA